MAFSPSSTVARAPLLLAIASPTADLAQFAREALWMAQERDLGLTLAVRGIPRAWSQLMGYTTAEDLAGFAERWGITRIPKARGSRRLKP